MKDSHNLAYNIPSINLSEISESYLRKKFHKKIISHAMFYKDSITKKLDAKQIFKASIIIMLLLLITDITLFLQHDVPSKIKLSITIFKIISLAIILFGVKYIWNKFRNERIQKMTLERDLIKNQEIASSWKKRSQNFKQEFQQSILRNFETWNLSKSEKEIAILLLQGMSSKKIGSCRFTSERTIRNQCRSIYEKSKQDGRNELTAFFLNDLIKEM